MQNGTVVQNQVPSAELVRISRQSATERPHDDDWAVKSVSLESDRIKAADAQTYRDGDIGERNSESEVSLTLICHVDVTEISFSPWRQVYTHWNRLSTLLADGLWRTSLTSMNAAMSLSRKLDLPTTSGDSKFITDWTMFNI